jgi:putative peptidoglycan lipid II flippase
MCATLFQYGEFTAHDSRMVAAAIVAMSVGVPAFMLSKVLLPAFYARQDTRTPMRAAIATVVANVVLTIALVTPLWHAGYERAHGGIALATALAGILNTALLWRALRREGLYRPEPGWGRLALQIGFGLVAMAAVVLACRHAVADWGGLAWYVRVALLLGMVAAGAATYAAALGLAGLRPRHLREH